MSLGTLLEESRRIMSAALAAADPRRAMTSALAFDGSVIHACGRDVAAVGRLVVVAAGKASVGMAEAALAILGPRVTEGLVVLPHGYPTGGPWPASVRVLPAAHPFPDEHSAAAGREVMGLADSMSAPDVCVLLLSGGGSSLLSLPLPPLSLAHLAETNRLLIASSADIHEINTVRRHLCALFGGRLAQRCAGTILTLAVSDVVGDELHAIASGPTVADPTSFADAAAVLDSHGLRGQVPLPVRELVEAGVAGRLPETPKSVPARHAATVIASGRLAVDAAAAEARSLGFPPHVMTTELTGEAREAGRLIAETALEVQRVGQPVRAPACLIAAGETTVTVRGSGRGGRNQEIALSAASVIAGVPGVLLTSFATDGKEGNTDAAGAFVSGSTIAAGRAAGKDERTCLEANDAHSFLEAAGGLIVTGPTGTNVNDITFVLVET